SDVTLIDGRAGKLRSLNGAEANGWESAPYESLIVRRTLAESARSAADAQVTFSSTPEVVVCRSESTPPGKLPLGPTVNDSATPSVKSPAFEYSSFAIDTLSPAESAATKRTTALPRTTPPLESTINETITGASFP